MRNDVADNVRVAGDHKIETPVAVHPGLPDIFTLVIFVGMQGRMLEIFQQQLYLLVKSFLDCGRRGLVALQGGSSELALHRVLILTFALAFLVWLWRNFIISL